jgi:hypothetical protein
MSDEEGRAESPTGPEKTAAEHTHEPEHRSARALSQWLDNLPPGPEKGASPARGGYRAP